MIKDSIDKFGRDFYCHENEILFDEAVSSRLGKHFGIGATTLAVGSRGGFATSVKRLLQINSASYHNHIFYSNNLLDRDYSSPVRLT